MLKGMQNGIQNIYLLQFLEFYNKPQNYTVSSKSVGTVKRNQFCISMYNCNRLVSSEDLNFKDWIRM